LKINIVNAFVKEENILGKKTKERIKDLQYHNRLSILRQKIDVWSSSSENLIERMDTKGYSFPSGVALFSLDKSSLRTKTIPLAQ